MGQFLAWCAARGLGLTAVSPLHVAAYIRTHPGSAPTVKQHLAAIRMLGDWLVVSQVLPVNPAAAVRGPTHVVTTGATPVLSPAEARRLLEAIDTGTLAGLRDRALVSVMLYSFARVSAGHRRCGGRTTSGRRAGGGAGVGRSPGERIIPHNGTYRAGYTRAKVMVRFIDDHRDTYGVEPIRTVFADRSVDVSSPSRGPTRSKASLGPRAP